METTYWNPDEFAAANLTDVKLGDKKVQIRALSPEELIDFQIALKKYQAMEDDDPERLRATFTQMKDVVMKATVQPSLSPEAVSRLGRLLVPLFNEIMRFSGMDGASQEADEAFRS